MTFFAHSILGQPPDQWQPLHEHLAAAAHKAAEFAAAFGSGEWTLLCGLLHDLGKFSSAFQQRLAGGRRVDHSLAGALEAITYLESGPYALLAKPIAHVISGHHTGLADGVAGQSDAPSLKERLAMADKIPDYSAWRGEILLP
ncbi:MAG: CRISPR-associated endonuclease Cas3'', partial [Deltaproteobacteria bacterium]|nr:CRISPR-associated endonuclease Cas3'' [Deltaproteobacteria bacterium]